MFIKRQVSRDTTVIMHFTHYLLVTNEHLGDAVIERYTTRRRSCADIYLFGFFTETSGFCGNIYSDDQFPVCLCGAALFGTEWQILD